MAYNHEVEAEKKRRRNRTRRGQGPENHYEAEMQPVDGDVAAEPPRVKPPKPVAPKPRPSTTSLSQPMIPSSPSAAAGDSDQPASHA